MKRIILISTLLAPCLQSAINAADTVTLAPYPYWHSLPEEIQDTILDTFGVEEKKLYGTIPTSADYTLLYQSYATVQKITMTQRSYRQWSKQAHEELKKHVVSLKHNLLMSLVDVDSKTILESLRKQKRPQLGDTNENNLQCALEQLNDIALSLERPLSQKVFMQFLTSSSQLLLSKKPRALIPNLRFIHDYYSPFMLTLIENNEYDLLSFLISNNYPLIIGDRADSDHSVLLEKNAHELNKRKDKSVPEHTDAQKIRSILENAYMYNIYSNGTYHYSTYLHAPKRFNFLWRKILNFINHEDFH